MPTRRTCYLLSTPFRRRHRRSLADSGFNRELVHETTHTRQSQSQSARSGVRVLHRALDVSDAGSAIAGRDGDAAPVPAVHGFQANLSSGRVRQHVSSELGDRRGDSHDIGGGESELGGERPPFLSGNDDVAVRVDRNADLTGRHRIHHAPDPRAGTGPTQRRRFSRSRYASPASKSRAVATPSRCNPSCTIVIATSGCTPTSTVFAPRSRVMYAISRKVRVANESSTSIAMTSMITAVARLVTTRSSSDSRNWRMSSSERAAMIVAIRTWPCFRIGTIMARRPLR